MVILENRPIVYRLSGITRTLGETWILPPFSART